MAVDNDHARASPLSSPTDYAGRSITAASTTDLDGFSSGAGRGRAGAWLRQHHRRHPSDRHADRHPTSTTPSCAFHAPPSGSRLRPVALLLRAGGARRLRVHHLLLSAGRRPAAGSCRLQDCSAWGLAGFYYAICCTLQRMGVRRIRRQHLLHSAGRRPAAGFGRLPSCSTLGVPAPTTPCCVICWQLSSNRLRLAVAPHCTMGVPPTALYAPPPPALEPDHNLPYVLNPSHGPNTYTCSPLWRIHPQPGLAALILSAAKD
jgi:hypothetical protein